MDVKVLGASGYLVTASEVILAQWILHFYKDL